MTVQDTLDGLEARAKLERVERKLMDEVISLIGKKLLHHKDFFQRVKGELSGNKKKAKHEITPEEYVKKHLSPLADLDPVVLYESKEDIIHKMLASHNIKEVIEAVKAELDSLKSHDHKENFSTKVARVENHIALLREYSKKDDLKELTKDLHSFGARLEGVIEGDVDNKHIKKLLATSATRPGNRKGVIAKKGGAHRPSVLARD